MASSRYVVGRVDDMADGERVTVDANGRSIVVFRRDGEFHALLNRCPHRGASLCQGRFVANITSDAVGEYVFHGEDRLLACPWHGWEFDIATGQSFFDPSGTRARPFPVEVASGEQVRAEIDAGETACTPAEFAARTGTGTGTEAAADGKVPGPYTAETFEVTVEDDYIVLLTRPRRRPRREEADRAVREGSLR